MSRKKSVMTETTTECRDCGQKITTRYRDGKYYDGGPYKINQIPYCVRCFRSNRRFTKHVTNGRIIF